MANAATDDAIVFVSINNEPASRIQSTFNRYFAGELPECLIDVVLDGEEQAQSSLNRCGSSIDRLWFISRIAKDDDQANIQRIFFDAPDSRWHVEQEQAYTGLVVRLLTPR